MNMLNQPLRPRWTALPLACVLLWAGACGDDSQAGDEASEGQPSVSTLYSADVTTIVLEVDYGTGAEPYDGDTDAGTPLWDFFGMNAARMFQASPTPKTITYPTTLEEMQELTDIADDAYTGDEILTIADAHRDQKSEGSTATFYVLWLDGYYETDEGVQEGVLGVSFGDTGVIAMFKPVISSAQGPLMLADRVNQFVEQTTLVHEFGHAAGMVNRGVPLTSEHHDEEHGAHCTNTDCVMYYANEGAGDLIDFVVQLITTGDTIVFQDACLADMDALASGE